MLAFEYFFENVDGFGYINEKGEIIKLLNDLNRLHNNR